MIFKKTAPGHSIVLLCFIPFKELPLSDITLGISLFAVFLNQNKCSEDQEVHLVYLE